MSLIIRLDINNERIDEIRVVNRGPVGGIYDPGDAPGGDGPRRYSWESKRGSGTVLHWRAEGAHALAARVLDQAAMISNVHP